MAICSIIPFLFPNPFNDHIFVEYMIPEEQGNLNMTIYDLSGRLLRSFKLERTRESQLHKKEIDLSDLAKGAYQLHISNDRGEGYYMQLVKIKD
ncbi:MAG: T9SS type A sorting domain-containing protein [Bacteroidetes bacterium]|nr:T9SS type A sorting domain-containing protein [Bacteroidota bacterium]MBU1719147.1 T9SS type A sorting domain-containing protein [Bacteroidota bacterium]